MLFKTSVSLLIFLPDDLSIDENGMWKFPTIIVLLSMSPFMLFYVLRLFLCWVNVYIYFLRLLFFLTWTEFLKSLLNLLQYCFWGMWDLTSLTRDQTCTPCIGRQSVNHWTTREVPGCMYIYNCYILFLDWSLDYYVISFLSLLTIFFFFLIYLFLLFIYFWLCWVFVSVRGLSLVVASGGHSSLWCAGLYRGLSCCGAQAPDAQAQ